MRLILQSVAFIVSIDSNLKRNPSAVATTATFLLISEQNFDDFLCVLFTDLFDLLLWVSNLNLRSI